MKRILIVTALAVAAVSGLYAETDPKAMPIIQDIQQGRDNNNQIDVLRVKGAATIGGALTAGSVVAPVTGDVTGNVVGTDVSIADDLKLVPQAQNVTNTQVVTLESGSLLSGVGQASGETNAITIAAPGASFVGKIAVIAIGATSSNIVAIADQSPCDLAGAAALGVGDTLTLWATSATAWLEVSRSNN